MFGPILERNDTRSSSPGPAICRTPSFAQRKAWRDCIPTASPSGTTPELLFRRVSAGKMICLVGRPAQQRKKADHQDHNVTDDGTRSPSTNQAVEQTCELGHGVTSQGWRERSSVS
jgi:hypothetical protein